MPGVNAWAQGTHTPNGNDLAAAIKAPILSRSFTAHGVECASALCDDREWESRYLYLHRCIFLYSYTYIVVCRRWWNSNNKELNPWTGLSNFFPYFSCRKMEFIVWGECMFAKIQHVFCINCVVVHTNWTSGCLSLEWMTRSMSAKYKNINNQFWCCTLCILSFLYQ